MSQLKFGRRQFIARAGQTLGFLGVTTSVFDFVISELYGKALSQAMGATGDSYRNEYQYIHVSLPGGPPRWYFDLILNPTGSTNTSVFNTAGFGNWVGVNGGKAISTNEYFKYTYAKGKTISLPPIWGKSLPGTDFASLLENTMFIRGMDMEINSHSLSNSRQVAPIINGLSVSGLVGDASRKPIPGIVTNSASSSAFKSRKGSPGIALVDTANPILSLLKPFNSFSSAATFQGKNWAEVKEQALTQFDDYAKSIGVTESSLRDAYDSANSMIEAEVYKLGNSWTEIFNKYDAVVKDALSYDSVVNDLFKSALPTSDTPDFRTAVGDKRAVSSDLRAAFKGVGTSSPFLARMAQQFAAAEILLGADITSTVTLSLGGIQGVNVNGASYAVTHDQHHVGRVPSALFTNVFYRAVLGCLSKQVQFLKAQNRFDRSVIHIGAEFNRSPRMDGSGSDHGVQGSNATLISGMIKRNSLIGNIRSKVAGEALYTGTWGVAADYNFGTASRVIKVNDVAATLATMMNLNPSGLITNGLNLLNLQTGLPVVEEAKNV